MLRLAQGEKAYQGQHFELLTDTETSKIAEIRNFSFDAISKKNFLKTVEVSKIGLDNSI